MHVTSGCRHSLFLEGDSVLIFPIPASLCCSRVWWVKGGTPGDLTAVDSSFVQVLSNTASRGLGPLSCQQGGILQGGRVKLARKDSSVFVDVELRFIAESRRTEAVGHDPLLARENIKP